MTDTPLARWRAAYAALSKAPGDDSPLARRHPTVANHEHLTAAPWWLSAGTAAGAAEVERYAGAARAYQQYIWLRKAISVITATASPLAQRVVAADGTPVPGHPLNRLFEQPNDQADGAELRELTWVDKLLGGEYFLEVVDDARGQPAELWRRRPDEVSIAPDEARMAYPAPLGYAVAGVNGLVPPSHMIHEMFPHPTNPWRGISVIGAAREEIAADMLVLANAQKVLRDGTRQFAITSDELLTPDERARSEAILRERYGRDRPLLLEGGQKVQSLMSAPSDLEWLAARDYAREGVGALFNVPDEIMGFGRDTYQNFETAYRVFWLLCLLPMIQRRDATYTAFFTRQRPLLRPGERVATDLSSVDALQEALGPKLEQAARLWAMGVPYNTAEKVLRLGTGAIPGGDVSYVPASAIPAALAGAAAEGAPASRAAAAVALKAASTRRDEQRLRAALQSYLREQYETAARAVEEERNGRA